MNFICNIENNMKLNKEMIEVFEVEKILGYKIKFEGIWSKIFLDFVL